jgi:hypothetical protein
MVKFVAGVIHTAFIIKQSVGNYKEKYGGKPCGNREQPRNQQTGY